MKERLHGTGEEKRRRNLGKGNEGSSCAGATLRPDTADT